MTRAKYYNPLPIIPVEKAWQHLASDVLELAIEDARQEGDRKKRYKARNWLASPAAKLLFDSLPVDIGMDFTDWALQGFPILGKK